MNGAHSLVRTLVAGGVDTCFMNPGTSEMHFVAALDDVPDMRGVLALFEGVATGAADGYARMRGTPAAVLLHLGPGLGNGLANLHNARKARVPVVVIVGDHALHQEGHQPGIAKPGPRGGRQRQPQQRPAQQLVAPVPPALAEAGQEPVPGHPVRSQSGTGDQFLVPVVLDGVIVGPGSVGLVG